MLPLLCLLGLLLALTVSQTLQVIVLMTLTVLSTESQVFCRMSQWDQHGVFSWLYWDLCVWEEDTTGGVSAPSARGGPRVHAVRTTPCTWRGVCRSRLPRPPPPPLLRLGRSCRASGGGPGFQPPLEGGHLHRLLSC